MPLIDRKYSGNILLIDRKRIGNVMLIHRKLVELENDAEYTFLLKLIELVKKLFNITRVEKEKPYCPISYSLICFIELVGRPYFYFAEDLMGLIDSLAMVETELRQGEIAVGFSE